jgi:hypothetical protein
MVFTDRTGVVGAGGSLLSGLPPAVAGTYLLLRLLIPVLLIVLAGRGATPAQRIGLVRDYLLGAPGMLSAPGQHHSEPPALPPATAPTSDARSPQHP